jgi:hypothetical protein
MRARELLARGASPVALSDPYATPLPLPPVAALPPFLTFESMVRVGLYRSIHAARRAYHNGELPEPTQNGSAYLFETSEVLAKFRERAGRLNPKWSKDKAAAKPIIVKRRRTA